jgi:hypothetical protein
LIVFEGKNSGRLKSTLHFSLVEIGPAAVVHVESMKKAFMQLSQMKEATSNISNSDTLEGDSHFLFQVGGFQFMQVDNEFKLQITKMFKQMLRTKIKLDLRQVILLDSQSTMDLICNPALIKKTFRSDKSMCLKSNGRTMMVTHRAKMAGYHAHLWYDKKAITNILALCNVIKQYPVTYDSDDQMFVVHQESKSKPNMEFWMHKSRLHYYNP